MTSSIWIAGEVLIDLVPQLDLVSHIDLVPRRDTRVAIVGGGPANTAKALARLGFDAQFIDGISTDHYGQKARAELLADGVNLEHSLTSDKPTCTATVTLDSAGGASYEFLISGTATFEFDESWLPNPTNPPAVLHIGTLATIVEPGATHLFAWAKQVKAPLIFDPNIRSSVVSDRALYQGIVEKWASIASVIKLSDEDLAWLYPGQEEQQIAHHFLHSAAELVVVTKGAEGMTAYTEGAEISVPGVKVQVVDTVGAGDTVGAILAEAIVKYGLENLVGDTLKKVLNRAAKAAAITCSRPGANPPNQKELEGF